MQWRQHCQHRGLQRKGVASADREMTGWEMRSGREEPAIALSLSCKYKQQ